MIKIAIVDVLGLSYDGDTLSKRGLGGSESAIISIARELAAIGCSVSVFNDCKSADDVHHGMFDGVCYLPYTDYDNTYFDVMIVSRSVSVFAAIEIRDKFKSSLGTPAFDRLVNDPSVHKILYMHDTFCDGDQLIEPMCQAGVINEIFTLSDWHTSYVGNCDHGKKRHYDILKKYIWQTRNGINVYKDFVDIKKKDPNLFVFNASVTKGMIPLVKEIWPEVKKSIPDAKLTVIGGYYRFQNGEPDQQEKEWQSLVESSEDINFTGIIAQSVISNILASASYMIYPCAFPETFGISTLEALAHNVPLLTCNYGALEETAIDIASFKIDGPIEKNWAFADLDEVAQRDSFVKMVCGVYTDKYLHYQAMYACNQVKDICGWDTVAKQWKQHLYRTKGLYLPVKETRETNLINYKVAKVFGRRHLNKEDLFSPKGIERGITVIVPVYNGEQYITKCIESIAAQNYDSYHVRLVDDCSTDSTVEVMKNACSALPKHVAAKFEIFENNKNFGALFNQMDQVAWMEDDKSDIVMLLDGDDSLVNDPNIFDMYNDIYANPKIKMTYGSCWSLADNIPLIAEPYPSEVFADKSFRSYKFNWGIPYTHLRTFTYDHIRNIDDSLLMDENFEMFKSGGDAALFYASIETCNADEVLAVPHLTVNYNDLNPNCDYKINSVEQTNNAEYISKMTQSSKILIAVPTNVGIETDTFKSIYDLDKPASCTTDFQYFFGYEISQVRNLICDYAIKNSYNYVLWVDSDIILPKDALTTLYRMGVSYASGVYRQRFSEAIEAYDINFARIVPMDNEIAQVGATGFGCVLTDTKMLAAINYPQFEYHSAIDHSNTFSEDIDFGKKAAALGYQLWLNGSVKCGHIAKQPVYPTLAEQPANPIEYVLSNLRSLSEMPLLPKAHVEYLKDIKAIDPEVIYDIGSCVMHWTTPAMKVWPNAEFICFEAMHQVEPLYRERGVKLIYGSVLGDVDGKQVEFYENPIHPGGNSIYRESRTLSPRAEELFPESCKVMRTMRTLDSLVSEYNLPRPSLIKMDVQGSELNVLKGATETLKWTRELILELQHKNYNEGAPLCQEVIDWLAERGFVHHYIITSGDLGVDADYHFWR